MHLNICSRCNKQTTFWNKKISSIGAKMYPNLFGYFKHMYNHNNIVPFISIILKSVLLFKIFYAALYKPYFKVYFIQICHSKEFVWIFLCQFSIKVNIVKYSKIYFPSLPSSVWIFQHNPCSHYLGELHVQRSSRIWILCKNKVCCSKNIYMLLPKKEKLLLIV